jgi:hypothetical protein
MEFEVFQDIREAPSPLPKDMPWGGYNFDMATLAVIASDDDGNGAVLWSVGPHIDLMREELGYHDLERLNLQPESAGIWVWEGRRVWYPGPYEYPEDGEMLLEGEFRAPTDEEWACIHRNECPWNDDEWLDPKYKDLILADRKARSEPQKPR